MHALSYGDASGVKVRNLPLLEANQANALASNVVAALSKLAAALTNSSATLAEADPNHPPSDIKLA